MFPSWPSPPSVSPKEPVAEEGRRGALVESHKPQPLQFPGALLQSVSRTGQAAPETGPGEGPGEGSGVGLEHEVEVEDEPVPGK
jgi:hypothetical protein